MLLREISKKKTCRPLNRNLQAKDDYEKIVLLFSLFNECLGAFEILVDIHIKELCSLGVLVLEQLIGLKFALVVLGSVEHACLLENEFGGIFLVVLADADGIVESRDGFVVLLEVHIAVTEERLGSRTSEVAFSIALLEQVGSFLIVLSCLLGIGLLQSLLIEQDGSVDVSALTGLVAKVGSDLLVIL